MPHKFDLSVKKQITRFKPCIMYELLKLIPEGYTLFIHRTDDGRYLVTVTFEGSNSSAEVDEIEVERNPSDYYMIYIIKDLIKQVTNKI